LPADGTEAGRIAGPSPAREERGLNGLLRRIDQLQQRHPVLAFPYAVIKKFGDDQAGGLAALVAYYGFFSVFPLLLVFVTILEMLLRGNPHLQQTIVNSALRDFPVIGPQIKVRPLGGSGITMAIGIALTLWGGLGVARAMQTAMNSVWNVPFEHRPNFLKATARALLVLVVLGVLTVAAAAAGSVGSGSGHWWWAVLGVAVALGLNLALFLLAFRILTSENLTWGDVLPGAIAGAVGWTILQALGGYIVAHQLKGASETYGTFAVVIGLLAWIYLGAQLTLYAAEVNVVRKRRLWPRSIVHPPFTEADTRALRQYATQEDRTPHEQVDVEIDAEQRGAGG
jgi:membrane protein